MFRPDRWASKILDLPVFDPAFAQAVKKTPLSSLAFTVALEAPSGSEFVEKVLELGRSWDESITNKMCSKEENIC